MSISPAEISEKAKSDFTGFLGEFALAIFYGIVVWALLSIFVTFVLYKALTPLVAYGMERVQQIHRRGANGVELEKAD